MRCVCGGGGASDDGIGMEATSKKYMYVYTSIKNLKAEIHVRIKPLLSPDCNQHT